MNVQANWLRTAVCVLVGAVLAAVLGAQAYSSATTRTSPDIAATVFPMNGLARGGAAYSRMVARGALNEGIPVADREDLKEAKAALRVDPLVPKAHLVVALSRTNPADRRQILEVANRLNRRDLALQALVLRENLADRNYEETVATLDRILRVHPRYTREFFPVLLKALTDEETVGTFATLLDGSSLWHASFLNYASRQNEAYANLAKLRPQLDFENQRFKSLREVFDQRMVLGLAKSGDLEASLDYYREVSENRKTGEVDTLDWQSQYPPIDWRFVDQAGFRAQNAIGEDGIEVSVRPGKGGVFAERIVKIPSAPFRIDLDYSIKPRDRARDMRLVLTCVNGDTPFLDENFRDERSQFLIQSTPADCEFVKLALAARAWSGRSKLDIRIRSIALADLASGS